jgi:exodeoxyribonuclease VII small subunit
MVRERFEEALQKLERVVAKLEEGNIPLEESLRLFEEGIRLSRFCNQKLEEAEKKVEILMQDRDGTLKARPFDPFRPAGDGPEIPEQEKPAAEPTGDEET